MKRVFSGVLACATGLAAAFAASGSALCEPKAQSKKADKPLTGAEQAAVSSGALTTQEAQLNCKRMAGRMQVRIMELRGGGTQRKGSSSAQGMQSALVPIFGGTSRGADAQGDRANDLTKMKAMNDILVARNCPYYDLEGELAKGHHAPTPRLIRSKGPASKAKSGRARDGKRQK